MCSFQNSFRLRYMSHCWNPCESNSPILIFHCWMTLQFLFHWLPPRAKAMRFQPKISAHKITQGRQQSQSKATFSTVRCTFVPHTNRRQQWGDSTSRHDAASARHAGSSTSPCSSTTSRVQRSQGQGAASFVVDVVAIASKSASSPWNFSPHVVVDDDDDDVCFTSTMEWWRSIWGY